MKFLSRRSLFKAGAGAAIAGKEMVKANTLGMQGQFQPAMPPSGGGYPINSYQVEPPNPIEQLDNANFVAARKQSLEAVARGEFSEQQLAALVTQSNNRYLSPSEHNLNALKSISNCARHVISNNRLVENLKLATQKQAKRELKRYYSDKFKALLVPRSISEHLDTLQKYLPGQDHDDI